MYVSGGRNAAQLAGAAAPPAARLSRSCSNPNSGACTPTTVSPRSAYFSDHARTYGSVRSQLTHEYVQTSTTTTRPARASAVSGSELSHTGARSSGVRALLTQPLSASALVSCREPRIEDAG